MKERGILLDYIALIDTSKMGFQTYALYLQIMNPLRTEEVIHYLDKRPEIWGIDKLVGKYHLYTTVYVRNVKELELLISDLGEKFGNIITNYRLLLIYYCHSPAHNYLFKGFEWLRHDKVRFASKERSFTDKQHKLLQVILRDPRISFSKLAEEIKTTRAKAREMFNTLVKEEVILFIRPSIDATRLGYLHKHVLIRLKLNAISKLPEIREFFMGLRATKVLSSTFGTYDLTGRFIFESLDEFQAFREEIWRRFGKYVKAIHDDDYYEDRGYNPSLVAEK